MPKIQCSRCANYFPNNRQGAVHIAGCRRYNGWTNYETWVVALWLDNDRGSHEFWRDRATELASAHPIAADSQLPRAAVHSLARELEERHEEDATARVGQTSDVFTDLLNGALSEVDWTEVAEHFFDE